MKNYLLVIACFISSLMMAQTGTTIVDSILSGGVYRTYVLYVSAIYTSSDTVPLIFNIHGGTGDGNQQMQFGDFRPIADTANFIVVHPTALPDASGNPYWNLGDNTDMASVADRKFLYNLLGTLKSQYHIDSNKVYSTGFSQGGLMSYLLACFQNVNFAAIASVSGGIKVSNFYGVCAPDRPTPVMEVHGTADPVAGYNGLNTITPSSPPSVNTDTLIKHWVNYNHCNPVPIMTNLPDINTSDSSTVEHYVYSGGTQEYPLNFTRLLMAGMPGLHLLLQEGPSTMPETDQCM